MKIKLGWERLDFIKQYKKESRKWEGKYGYLWENCVLWNIIYNFLQSQLTKLKLLTKQNEAIRLSDNVLSVAWDPLPFM